VLQKLIDGGLTYPVIYTDNPWTFNTYSAKGGAKSPSKHYHTMTIEDIKKLPVAEVAAKDCILLTWVYQPLLPEALEVMGAWGFDYKSIAFVWNKLSRVNGKPHMSTGYYTRAGMEMCILGRRGNPPRVKDRGVRQVFSSKVREHSQKPDEVYDFIERLYDGPYLEMFARNNYRKDWTKVGDEVGKLV
jgi:N6-adenosine-specific RNA methylase IME4